MIEFQTSFYYCFGLDFSPHPTLTEPSQPQTETNNIPFFLTSCYVFVERVFQIGTPVPPNYEQRDMAKRSDFAQKLLDDLRLRKERLAASQSSNRQANPSAADAYAHAKKNYRGSRRELKTTEATGFRNGTLHNKSSSRGNKSFIGGGATNQIVPFGRGQSAEHIGNLSMAVAFALENGGKLKRMDSSVNNSMLGFLQQLGSTSLDYEKMSKRNNMDRQHRPSSSHFPALSQFHIKEISKGAQKLNQILRACSNGVNFDSYSREVGKELLKGAIDLEESLRMLVNLQEASDYMITPQRKTRITLLDEDEDEDDNNIENDEQKQLGLPQFSFDKPSRNYHNSQQVARNDLLLRLAAITYPSDANFIYEKQSTSQKRSASTGSNAKGFAPFLDQKNRSSSSQSRPEKGRIPSVIAKLMGLNELPQNVDSKYTTAKETGSKKKAEEKLLKRTTTVQASTKKVKKRTDDIENLVPQSPKKKVTQPNKSPAVMNTVALRADTDQVIHDRKPSWKDFEGIKPITGFEKPSIKADKQQGYITRLNHNIGSLKDTQEKYREQKGVERSKMKEPVLKNELQWIAPETHKRSEAAAIFQEKTGYKGRVIQTENIYTNKILVGTRQKSPNNLGFQPPHMKSEARQAEEKEQQNAKQKLPTRKQKGSELISTPLSKPMHDEFSLQKKQYSRMNQAAANKKSFTETIDAMQSERYPSVRRPHEDLASKRNSTNLNVNTRASMSRNSTSPKAVIPSVKMENKPVHESDTWKVESNKIHKKEIPPKINEVMIIRRGGGTMQNSNRPVKNQNSALQEFKQRSVVELNSLKEVNQVRAYKTKEAQVSLIKPNKSVASIHSPVVAQELQKKPQQASTLHSPVQDENQSLKEPETLPTNDSCQDIISVVLKEHQGQEPSSLREDEELKSDIIESTPRSGIHQDSSDIYHPSQVKYRKKSKPETTEPLTESDNHLKQILIKSQIFLNTAEALFKLNIPYGILDGGGHGCQDEDSKVILDCGYEVMKRKGRKQELSVHPFVRLSITAKRARSLDDLVIELNKDIDKLKLYGRNGNVDAAIEAYLPKMLESDVYNKGPDLNSMWDLSWDEMMFAFIEKDDVVRDVERYVLNGLVDEITLDLLQVQEAF
ncbi:hypothetical protein Ddye_007053 [Dipteronia dyeriana]|uniref:DUF3741 domain-containing protein n=1 Tax=Dipteronia dyeriana TaxID=168575 RepID=A0AAE0CR44_9ROSI|nr:hypothetical protein Ddye_007053 [Dipteronia dyeriana]